VDVRGQRADRRLAAGDNTHLSPNPTFTVTFRDANRMLLFSDTEVQLEFVRQ